jgi:thioredoxin reductase (NADPH)
VDAAGDERAPADEPVPGERGVDARAGTTPTVAGIQAPTRPKPVILTVDDDPQVLAAVSRDLRRQYGERFRVVRAADGATALAALEELTLTATPVALIVADQRMPGLSGVEVLSRAKSVHPDARTVLLTAYADTDAAIAAINEVHLDHYVFKPWDPPEERLFPVLDDLLDDWEAGYEPEFVGLRLVGHRWSPDTRRLREFLARNLVPFRWVDVEVDAEEADRLRQATGDERLPLVVLADGAHQVAPTNREVAAAVGLRTTTETESFDLLVVGGGPAGLAAAVYGASEGLRTAVLEREVPGGQAGSSSRIENYLGFPNGLSGQDLARRAVDQARRLGAEIISPTDVLRLVPSDRYRVVELDDGTRLVASALIVASGVSYRSLDIPGVDEIGGAGVAYGASMHEARSYEGEDVVMVGGANSAGQAALYFARFARTVTLVVRARSLEARMSTYLVEQVQATPNIHVRLGSEVVAVAGDGRLQTVTLTGPDGERDDVAATGLFILIGAQPRTDWLAGAVERDALGFLIAGPDLVRGRTWKEPREPFSLETSLPGVFAAGDVRARSVKRVASAVGDGAIAVHQVHQYMGL